MNLFDEDEVGFIYGNYRTPKLTERNEQMLPQLNDVALSEDGGQTAVSQEGCIKESKAVRLINE